MPPRTVSVVIPVKDGARYLRELLDAVLAQRDAAPGGLEVLVIDSGSVDGSPAIARAAGAEVLEIDPAEFGHGRTRNLGAERTERRADLLPHAGRDAAARMARPRCRRRSTSADASAPSTAPTAPRPDTSPMIARELEEFFAEHAGPDGGRRVQGDGRRRLPVERQRRATGARAGREIRFADVPYSEDQAFGRAMLAAGWAKVFHAGGRGPARPRLPAGAVHAPLLRRVPRPARDDRPRRADSACGRPARRARRWSPPTGRGCASEGWRARRVAALDGALVVHHSGRKAFSALGSRAARHARARPADGSRSRARPDGARRRTEAPTRGQHVASSGRARDDLGRRAAVRARRARRRCSTPLPGQGGPRRCTSRRDPALRARLGRP